MKFNFRNVNTTVVFSSFVLLLVGALRADEPGFSFHDGENRTVLLKEKDKTIWRYNADFRAVPGVPETDPRFMAGSYVHPLYGIHGEILTDDAPKDHYHHHGVFWTWPHVGVHRPDGKVERYDVWTGNTRMKQLFVRFHDSKVEKDRAVFRVENGWFIAPKTNEFQWDDEGNPVSEKVVEEFVTMTTHPEIEKDGIRSRSIDFDFEWIVGKFPISLQGAEGKSYGGLTVRFRPSQGKPGGDSTITVPGGVAGDDLPDTPLPWADYTSKFERDASGKPTGKRSGAAVFVSKNHPDYPPSWLVRYYGPLCVGWPGVKEKTFQSGEKINLSYRIWIHDKAVSVEELEKAYEFSGE